LSDWSRPNWGAGTILVCTSLKVAHQTVADAKLLETVPAKQIFARWATQPSDD
jgi:hypothetical protein